MSATAATAKTTIKKPRPKSGAATRVSVHGVLIQRVLVGFVLGMYLCASIVSFDGLLSIASWTHVNEKLFVFVPIFIDGAIITYKIAELALKSRGQYKAARLAVAGNIFFTSISALANGMHVYSQWDGRSVVELIGGIVIAFISPWAIFLAAMILTHVVVKPKPVRAVPKPRVAAKRPVKRPSRAAASTVEAATE